jgi:sugar lactone lactonase YvrE
LVGYRSETAGETSIGYSSAVRMHARSSLLAVAMSFVAGVAAAHQIVDMKMTVTAPAFVAARAPFTYRVIADNLANDFGLGIVVTATLPASVTFVRASGTGWTCGESKLKVTCAGEQVAAGPNVITIDVTAPAVSGPIVSSVAVESLGSLDPNTANDSAIATTTVYDAAACPTQTLVIGEPADAGGPIASPAHLSWTPVPNARSYSVSAAVEGERSAIIATTTAASLSIPFERGNVEWHVEAFLGTCPTISSSTHRFLSGGRPEALTMRALAGHSDSSGILDGPSTDATFMSPFGITLDGTGNLFISDAASFTIREISGGQVTTPAGNPGVAGAADGRPGSFSGPMGIAYSPADDFILIADRGNQAVRLRYPGDRLLGYVLTIGGALGQPGLMDGLFEVSRFSAPSAVAPDPRGRIYIADSGNNRVRKLTSVPGYVGYYSTATFAGSSEGSADGTAALAQFRNPSGVAADGEEIVYVADTGNHTIRKIANGVVTTVAGLAGSPGAADGYGADARFNEPSAVAVDARGNLYVCDTGNHTIRKVSPSGLVTTVAGLAGSPGDSEGTASNARLSGPGGIAIDANGAIYIADTGNHRIVIAHVPIPSIERRHAALP